MLPTLHIRLFGDFNLAYGDDAVVSVSTPRLQSLLAYLVLHRDSPQPRHHLAFLFWPDSTEAQARNNLRQMLHQLREVLPDLQRFLQVDTSNLQWRLDAPFSLDVAEFEHALTLADVAERTDDACAMRAAFEHADSLYRADLLPSCYDQWIVPERERLRLHHLRALERLLDLLEAQQAYAAAIPYAQRLLQCDSFCEATYRRLMCLLALNHDRAGALRVYHRCATTLQRELGVEPDLATRAAYEQLLHVDTAVVPARERHPLFAATPTLIGRQREWERLLSAWRRAAAGEPHFVLVSGEAGIGKSRVAEELLAWANQQGIVTATTRSYAAEGQLSLAPVTDWLRSDGLRPHLARLNRVWLVEVARILPELCSEQPDLPRSEPVTEYGQRQRFFEALARAVLAAPPPVLLLIDDLQWCDQETFAWLHFLLRFDPTARLLVVGGARVEETPAQHPLRSLLLHLRATTSVTEIALEPLDAAETAKLATQVAGRELDVDTALRVYHETEGYPLFVVETMRVDLGQAGASTPEADHFQRPPPANDAPALPPRVYAVLAGRLAQLSAPTRAFVELAASIGREFTLDVLAKASDADADSAVGALDELWHKRIVREHGSNSYDFTHDKLREVAYAEISAPQRRMLHRRIAQALETIHADDFDSVSGQIAAHYERAGMVEQSIPHYQRAAAVAQHVYANEDAIGLLSRGLALLERLPMGSKRDAQELGLRLALAPIYRVTKGWAALELEQVLNRVVVLCDKVGDASQRSQALYGLQSLYVVQAKLEKVQHISDELGRLYQQAQGAAPPQFAGVMLTGAQLHLGHVEEANDRFRQITAVHDSQQLQHLQESQGANYLVLAQAWQSHALWCLGYPQAALHRCLEGVQLARDMAQPFNQALALAYLALLQQLRADAATASVHAEEALALALAYEAPYYRAWAAILVSYALAWEQPDPERIARLRESIGEFKAAGARLRLPYYFSLLAHVYGKAGRVEAGLAIIDDALAAAREHNERWWDAELHRLRGELLLAHGAEARDVEMAFLRAIEIARSQQARSLELRAATSLAGLWRGQNRSGEARQVLNDVYAWFSEGFDTPDLQAAQALLVQL